MDRKNNFSNLYIYFFLKKIIIFFPIRKLYFYLSYPSHYAINSLFLRFLSVLYLSFICPLSVPKKKNNKKSLYKIGFSSNFYVTVEVSRGISFNPLYPRTCFPALLIIFAFDIFNSFE